MKRQQGSTHDHGRGTGSHKHALHAKGDFAFSFEHILDGDVSNFKARICYTCSFSRKNSSRPCYPYLKCNCTCIAYNRRQEEGLTLIRTHRPHQAGVTVPCFTDSS